MYRPPAFRPADEGVAREVMRAHPFATLVTCPDGVPYASPLPFVLEGDALLAHMARANPQWRHFGDADVLVVFSGPHAYISPRWYTSPREEVPTWNYVTVHAYGRPQLLDPGETKAALAKLVAAEEARFAEPWAADPGVVDELLPGIVGFRIALSRVEVKLKLSQNRAAEDAAGARAGLAAGSEEERAVAEWMRRAGVDLKANKVVDARKPTP